MGVPAELLKCACFLCVKRAHRGTEGFQYGGTAFFVSVPSDVHPSVSYIYLVTARDNVEKAQGAGDDLYIRLNRQNQSVDYLKIDLNWIMPEKGGVDLAIQGPYLDLSPFDSMAIPTSWAANEAELADQSIGIGDAVFCVGLFAQRYGTQQGQPLVRSGVIAALPNQPLLDSDGNHEYDAYLAEIRSVGWSRGSPVFVALPQPSHPRAMPTRHGRLFYLLGVIRGQWNVTRREIPLGIASVEITRTGLASVTPARELVALLNIEQVRLQRKARDQEVDSASDTQTRPFTRQDFESCLRKASRRFSPSRRA